MNSSPPEFYTLGPLPEINLGFVTLPTYYTVLSLTYCLGIFWFYKRCESRNLSQKAAMDIGLLILVGGFIGARLFHVLFEYPGHYWQNPIEVFYFWQGGFVFYGGFLFAYGSVYLYARKLKLTFWLWHDTAAPVLAGGYALGRLACFLVGCCYGKVCDLPWGTALKQVNIHTHEVAILLRHPTQLYASIFEFSTLAFLLWYEKRRPQVGNVFLAWVFLHSLGRIIMEIFRDDPRGAQYFGLSISTLISVVLMITVTGVFLTRPKEK